MFLNCYDWGKILIKFGWFNFDKNSISRVIDFAAYEGWSRSKTAILERFPFDSYGLCKRRQFQNLQNQEFESAYKDELIFMNSLVFSLHLE